MGPDAETNSARFITALFALPSVAAPPVDAGAYAAAVLGQMAAAPANQLATVATLTAAPMYVGSAAVRSLETVVLPVVATTLYRISGSDTIVVREGATPTKRSPGQLPVFPPGALSVLPGANLTNLSQGLKDLLRGLEQTAESRLNNGDGLRAWIISGAVAVAACELARRQLRRYTAEVDRVSRLAPIRVLNE